MTDHLNDAADDRADPVTAQARDWVLRLASGDMVETDMAAFKTWLAAAPDHQAAFERERQFWHRLEALKGQRPARVPVQRVVPMRRAAAVGMLLAACLALFVAVGGELPGYPRPDFQTAQGTQDRLVLADGSTVYLNTDTGIRVAYTDGERRIELLHGEALFDVQPNKARPFRVVAGGGVTEAVGTAFVIRTGGEGTTVTVTEGVVQVSSPLDARGRNLAAVRVERGQRTAYRKGGAPGATAVASAEDAVAWRRGLIRIDGLPLDAAVAELDRYVPGRILLLAKSAEFQPVSGMFDIDKADAAVDGLAATHGLSVMRLTPYLTVLR